MARVLSVVVEPPRVCSYLPEKRASLETRVMLDVDVREWERMLSRGWRRFGPFHFRPACEPCRECVSIRVPTATFTPSRSQRRARKSAGGLRYVVGRPQIDDARLELYARWHAMREETKGWEPSPHDEESYALHFAFPHPAAREVAFYDGDKLVGVGLSDETPGAWSMIFFYYDPDYLNRSIGVVNVLCEIEHARSLGIPHVYLGFRVMGCRSMEYKARYEPHELLHGRPSEDEVPDWRPAGATRSPSPLTRG